MTTPSNLYAEKIFSEQPIGLWALDEQADYVSLITEAQREIETQWAVSGGTPDTGTFVLAETQPFTNSYLTQIDGTFPVSSTAVVSCVSPNLVNIQDLDLSLETISIGSYIYFVPTNLTCIDSVSIGYQYTDPTTSLVVERLQSYDVSVLQKWTFISATLPLDNEDAVLRAVIKFNINQVAAATYEFYINGVTVGQWSEEFQPTSLGVTPISFPSTIALAASKVLEADQYGLGGDTGYYIVEDNYPLAKNTSVPLVYGATNLTKLSPSNSGLPSLIIPGKGFLNKAGQNKEYTVEFWARINSDTQTPKRIFGPIGSTDGLYVESGFLTFVIGEKFASHFVGEWYRPMLIDVVVIKNSASVLINGEQVINIIIDTDNLSLPDLLDNAGDSLDWLGFYCYNDVSPIDIDCVAIYPYAVPIIVAKRRWVYGQGVPSADSINSSYGGFSAFIDYPFADYTADYIYPDFAQWQQGSFDNLNTTNTSLQTPSYSLPDIFLSTKTLDQLYSDNEAVQGSGTKFITFRPNTSWDTINCYFNFPKFNIINDQVNAFYGVFDSDDLATEELLFKIYNPITNNYFSIVKKLDEIYYSLTYNGIEQEIYTTDIVELNEKFAAGIIIKNVVETFGGNVATFFGDLNSLKMYVCGDNTGTYQFTGKIYCIGLSTLYNTSQITDHFLTNGTAILDSHLATGSEISENALALLEHTASYTLLPTEAYDAYFLDIGISGYWEDYMPLSYFGQYVKNDVGNSYYDLDFLQFNVSYPKPAKTTEYETTSAWTYQQLLESYANPTQQPYSLLDNPLYTGWNNYEDMSQRAVKYFIYDTDQDAIKSSVTFQYISEGANAPQDFFTITEPLNESKVIDLDEYVNWPFTKFEVIDGTIIYPKKSVNFNDLAIVYRLDFNIRGIISKPISLRKLEISSQALSSESLNPIGTRFGADLIPYKKSGIYLDYKSKNPFAIYKKSTPYLYLSNDSGIEVLGDVDQSVSRGISFPINREKISPFNISAVQLWMKYNKDKFSVNPIELFSIDYLGDTIKFYLVADSESGLRGRVFNRIESSGLEYKDLSYYWNGSFVKEPVLTVDEWGVLMISLTSPINFNNYAGALNVGGPVVYNNLAYYQTNSFQQSQSTVYRTWAEVKENSPTTYAWQDWDQDTWLEVLVIDSTNIYNINLTDIYEAYIGTNKIIIDDQEGFLVNSDTLKVFSDATWSIFVKTPV